MKKFRLNITRDWATKKGYLPVAGPYRPDTEIDLLMDALANLRDADITLVVEASCDRDAFVGISIYRHKSECWASDDGTELKPVGRSAETVVAMSVARLHEDGSGGVFESGEGDDSGNE